MSVQVLNSLLIVDVCGGDLPREFVTFLISQKSDVASKSTYNVKNTEKSIKSQTLSAVEGARQRLVLPQISPPSRIREGHDFQSCRQSSRNETGFSRWGLLPPVF